MAPTLRRYHKLSKWHTALSKTLKSFVVTTRSRLGPWRVRYGSVRLYGRASDVVCFDGWVVARVTVPHLHSRTISRGKKAFSRPTEQLQELTCSVAILQNQSSVQESGCDLGKGTSVAAAISDLAQSRRCGIGTQIYIVRVS